MSRLLISLCLSLLFSTVQAQLSIPEFQKGKAILSGTISNYNPNDDLNFWIGVPNILMKDSEPLFPTIQTDGSFKVNIPLYAYRKR